MNAATREGFGFEHYEDETDVQGGHRHASATRLESSFVLSDMIIRTAIVCLFLSSLSFADDIYLRNGFVLRNVQVADTVNGLINVNRDGRNLQIDTTEVMRIDFRVLSQEEKSSYEMFSQELHDEYQRNFLRRESRMRERNKQLEASQNAEVADSLREIETHLDRLYSWSNSPYVSGGWGSPQGFRFELGYNFARSVALALSYGIGDDWSRSPNAGTFALLLTFRFATKSLPVTPYILLCTGGKVDLFGGPQDTYTLIFLGTMVELKSGIHLRPELGVARTSKQTEGGTRDDRTRFGVNLSIEVDFARAF